MLLFLFSESFLPYLLKTNPFHFPLQQSCFKMSIKGFQICEIVFPRIKLIPNVHSPSWIKSIKLMKPEVNKNQSNKKEHWLWRYHQPMIGWPKVNKHKKNTKAIKRSIGYEDIITLWWGDLAEEKHCSFGHRPYWGRDPQPKLFQTFFQRLAFCKISY